MPARRLSPAILTALAIAPTLLLLPFRAYLPDAILLFTVMVTVGVTLGVSTLAWKRLDETAREAHKSAWFWGAPFGLLGLLMVLAFLLLTTSGRDFLETAAIAFHAERSPWSPTVSAFSSGILLAGVVQSLAYGSLWIVWWLRRR